MGCRSRSLFPGLLRVAARPLSSKFDPFMEPEEARQDRPAELMFDEEQLQEKTKDLSTDQIQQILEQGIASPQTIADDMEAAGVDPLWEPGMPRPKYVVPWKMEQWLRYTPDFQKALDDSFEEAHEKVYKNIDPSRLARVLNDAEREFWVHSDVPDPTEAPDMLLAKPRTKSITAHQQQTQEGVALDIIREKLPICVVCFDRSTTRRTSGGGTTSTMVGVLLGDGKGTAGFGYAKARSYKDALTRAQFRAARDIVYVPRKEGRTFPKRVVGKFQNTKCILVPGPRGSGLKCSPFAYEVLQPAVGIWDGSCRFIGSRNRMNSIKALMDALRQMDSVRSEAQARGKTVYKMMQGEEYSKNSLYDEHGNFIIPDQDTLIARNARVASIVENVFARLEPLDGSQAFEDAEYELSDQPDTLGNLLGLISEEDETVEEEGEEEAINA